MSEDQFLKLYRYMTRRFYDLEAKIDTKADKAEVERIYVVFGGIAKRLDDNDVEHAAMLSQLNRHESYILYLMERMSGKSALPENSATA